MAARACGQQIAVVGFREDEREGRDDDWDPDADRDRATKETRMRREPRPISQCRRFIAVH